MNQTEVTPNVKVFLHNVPCTKEHDTDFEKNHNVEIHFPLTTITDAPLISSIATFFSRAESTLLTIFHCHAYFLILLDQNFRDGQKLF